MLEPRTISEKNLNKETHRIVGEVQLHRFGHFLANYNHNLTSFRKKLPNNFQIRSSPLQLESTIFEDVTLLKLVQSDNKLLYRILASLTAICEEIDTLITEAREYYMFFVFYGEEHSEHQENVHQISLALERLQKLNFFVIRAQNVIVLLIRQLCATLGKELYTGNSVTCFPEPLDGLAELLVCLVRLDSLLHGGVLQQHFMLYRRKVRSLLHSPSRVQVPLDQLRCLDKCLSAIDANLLNGTIFQTTLGKCVDDCCLAKVATSSLSREISLYCHQMIIELERDIENVCFTQIWLQVNVMFVFQYYLFGHLDKRFCKRLFDINKKTAACTMAGNILWYPEEFLVKYIPSLRKQLDLKLLAQNRAMQVSTRSQNLTKETQIICIQAYTWVVQMGAVVKKNPSAYKPKNLQNTCDLLIDGIKLVKKVNELVKWIMNLHADIQKPMTKAVLLSICKLIEVLKVLQFTFEKQFLFLNQTMVLVTQHLTHKALTILISIKKSFTQEKSYKEQQLDVISSLNVVENALKGPNTRQRILVAKLALSASGLSHDLSELRSVISRLELMCNVNLLLKQLCNCSFIYWHQVLLPVYFSKLVDSKINLTRFYLVFNALTDCSVYAPVKVERLTQGYEKNDILKSLNHLVETNLRLQTHLHLQLPPTNPFENHSLLNFKTLVPARFSHTYINIKEEVQHYLSTMFYNLTTVVLHDWRTYGEMRRLAYLQYGLSTVEDNLPMQTLEQGLDILEIMRYIQVFVASYSYNLNNQVFVEEKSNNKHLNTINISHVANSIRTHGIGIMNTTVNFTYQFLQKKFYIFSQFMFDEQIKARLLKNLKYFAEHKNELNQMYPYDKAEKFNYGIRKLGLDGEGQSYLDLFRKLITQIGNAMGFVRLIRSGGRRCVADATCFIPDLTQVEALSEVLPDNELPSSTTNKAAECFMHDVKNLVENFEEATEYFKLLVNVFVSTFRNPKNIHLRNFYVIVPPLTINFIEHLLTSKEKLNKKNRDGVAFTDDGFAIGLAYIIELLDQTKHLNSLHWFQSVKKKYMLERQVLERQKSAAAKEDVKLQETLLLTEKRLNTFEKEFMLLFYSFNSARIFFQM